MNLLTEYTSQINSVMGNIFDTFKRSTLLRFYKPAEEEVVIFDPDFNADLEEYHNPNANYTPQYQDFECRIIYPKRENTLSNFIGGGSNLQIKGIQELGIVYVQFKADALDYLKDSIRFTFEGEKYEKYTDIRKIGVLDTFNIYQLTLKKVN